jgi:hypothetical protein
MLRYSVPQSTACLNVCIPEPVFLLDIGTIPASNEFESIQEYYEFAKQKFSETKERLDGSHGQFHA